MASSRKYTPVSTEGHPELSAQDEAWKDDVSTDRLFPHHVELLNARGISEAYARSLGLFSVSEKGMGAICGSSRRGYPDLPHYPTGGLAIRYQQCLDTIPRARVRSDLDSYEIPAEAPVRFECETVKIPRYICQAGVPVVPYLRCIEHLTEDVTVPLYVVEAPLKAISLSEHGMPAIGLGGVVAGGHDREALAVLGEVVASKELRRIRWMTEGPLGPERRRVYIVFDAGVTRNPQVALGAARVAFALQQEGADAWLVNIPHHRPDLNLDTGAMYEEQDQGPDDYIARFGADALRALVEQAVPSDPVARFKCVLANAESGREGSEQIAQLLQQLPVQAMLHVGGHRLVDACAAVTAPRIGKRALREAGTEFADRLARREQAGEPAWKESLIKTMGGTVRATAQNVELCLRRDPFLAGLIVWNEFGQLVEFDKPPPWTETYAAAVSSTLGSPWTDDDDVRLAGYLSTAHEIHDLDLKKVQKSVMVVAKDRPRHPVRDYLKSVVWDGTPRLCTWLRDYFGATDNAEYLRLVGTWWMISAVARVMKPGCQVDHVLAVEGDQGLSKTSALRVLGGDWYCDAAQSNLDEKEAAILLQGSWLFVFDEGSIFSRSDALAQKEFVTKKDDVIVPKYSNRKTKVVRQCVFALTTNEENYLTDPTGNRRYWPVACSKINLEALTEDRDQLWAEALALFMAEHVWWPTTEEQDEILSPQQDRRRQVDSWEKKVAEGLVGKSEVIIEDILTDILDLKPQGHDHRARLRVGRVLRVLGWRQGDPRKIDGVTTRVYVKSATTTDLAPTRTYLPKQTAIIQLFEEQIPVEMKLVQVGPGVVLRQWTERTPDGPHDPADADDLLLDDSGSV